MSIRSELNRALHSRPLATEEAAAALGALQKCRRFQQNTGGWRRWIVDSLPDFASLDLAGSDLVEIASMEVACFRGMPMREELWHRFWGRPHPQIQGRQVRLRFAATAKRGSQVPIIDLSIGYYTISGIRRWCIGLAGDGLLVELGVAKSPAAGLSSDAQRRFMEAYQPLFGLRYDLSAGENDQLCTCIPKAEQECGSKASYKDQPFVVTLNHSGGDPTRPTGIISMDTMSQDQAVTICENIRRHYASHSATLLEWTESFEIRFHREAALWMSTEYSPPWILSCSPRIDRPVQPRWLVDEERSAGYIWPLGEWYSGGDTLDVDLLSEGAGRGSLWRLWFTALHVKQDKARQKLAAQIAQALNIPQLFECEQLVEKYAPLCR